MTGKLEISRHFHGDAAIVVPTGRVDGTTAAILRTALAELDAAGERRIVVDLGRVDYISSAGLNVLFTLAKQTHEIGGALAICALGDQVRRVFELAGYMPHFTVTATRDEAVARVRSRTL